MKITVNGKEEALEKKLSIMAFLEFKGVNPSAVVVEHNYEIPDRKNWTNILIKDKDNLEIVKFMGGG